MTGIVFHLVSLQVLSYIIEGSILRIIDHDGHIFNLEQPYEFNQHLFGFLKTLKDIDVGVALEEMEE